MRQMAPDLLLDPISPFSHKAKYYTIPPEVPYRGYTLKDITLVPAPEPVECWQPIQSGLRARLRVHGEIRHRRRLGRRRRGRPDSRH